MLKLPKLLIVLILLGVSIFAQERKNLGWDLTYQSVLRKNDSSSTTFITQWLDQTRSPIEKWISDWSRGQIISSILIEFPGFHAGERSTMWLVRANNEAHYYEWVEGKKGDVKIVKIKTTYFDRLFRKATSWRQFKPKPEKKLLKDEIPGYFGFLSFFDNGNSRQQLLTMDDFVICLNPKKGCEPGPGKLKLGRLMAALEPILVED